MVKALIYAPLTEFFERMPLGVILNRFSKDLYVLDMEMGYHVGSLTVVIFSLTGALIQSVYSSSLYVLIPLSILLYVVF